MKRFKGTCYSSYKLSGWYFMTYAWVYLSPKILLGGSSVGKNSDEEMK